MNHRCVGWLTIGFGCAVALAGCSTSAERAPMADQDTAKQAMETMLDAWKNGQARPDKLTLRDARIEVRDPTWNPGQKLNAYEIRSQETQGIARWFTIKLTLPQGERTAKYAVVGKDPIWIYAEEEFRKLSAWNDDPLHPPPLPTWPGRGGGR